MVENPKNLALSKVLDIEKMENVNQPIEKAHGLPNECYTSPNYLEIEREKIFKDKWTVIGVGSSVPKSGDAIPYNLLGIPLIILRDDANYTIPLGLTEVFALQVGQEPQYALAMTFAAVTTIPIIILFSFVQKYYIAGLSAGAVKG